MKAAVLYEPNTPLVVEEVELAPPRAREVMVRMVACGVCHSDLHVIDGRTSTNLPIVLGHEGAGIVERVGEGVDYVRPGDPVIICFTPPCGSCHYCVVGRPNLCTISMRSMGQNTLPDGTRRLRKGDREISHFVNAACFAQYAVVPESGVVKVGRDVPLDKVCLVGCAVMTGVGAVINTAKVQPGSSVAVFGCGGVGLNVVQGAALAGAEKIIAVDLLEAKLRLAQQFGASHLVNASQSDPVQEIRRLSAGGVDYAFEVIGAAETMRQAFDVARRGGMTVVIGVAPTGTEVSIPAMALLQEKVLTGSAYGSTRPRVDMPRLVDLYLAGKLKVDELIHRTFPLEGINEAFDLLRRGEVARSVILF